MRYSQQVNFLQLFQKFTVLVAEPFLFVKIKKPICLVVGNRSLKCQIERNRIDGAGRKPVKYLKMRDIPLRTITVAVQQIEPMADVAEIDRKEILSFHCTAKKIKDTAISKDRLPADVVQRITAEKLVLNIRMTQQGCFGQT